MFFVTVQVQPQQLQQRVTHSKFPPNLRELIQKLQQWPLQGRKLEQLTTAQQAW